MAELNRVLGTCPLCSRHGTLTQQHVRIAPDLEGTRIMICESCHGIVTRYEEELRKARQYMERGEPGSPTETPPND